MKRRRRRTKYRADPSWVDLNNPGMPFSSRGLVCEMFGIEARPHYFPSQLELERYLRLLTQERSGIIRDLASPQYKITLQPSFKYQGRTVRSVTYVADFYYFDTIENAWVIEDVKGVETTIFKLKWKMVKYLYRDCDVILRITKTPDG